VDDEPRVRPFPRRKEFGLPWVPGEEGRVLCILCHYPTQPGFALVAALPCRAAFVTDRCGRAWLGLAWIGERTVPNRRERQLQLSHEMDTLEREEARERAALQFRS
jgi:hypothetical protein